MIEPVDRGSRQAEEECVGESQAHLLAQIAFLRPVGFVHHDDHIAAFAKSLRHVSELENRGDQDLPLVVLEESNQFLLATGRGQIGNIGAHEVRRDLCFQVNTVIDDDHGRGLQSFLHTEFLRGKDHQQGFPAALEMPDQSLLRIPVQDALHDRVRAFVLLITADDFDLAEFPVSGVDGEIAHDVYDACRLHQGNERLRDKSQRSLAVVFRLVPWAPFGQRGTDGGVAECLAFRRERQDIWHKHLGNALFVALNILRSVRPAHAGADRRFQFADDERQTVDQKNQVQTFAAFAAGFWETPLIRDDVRVR